MISRYSNGLLALFAAVCSLQANSQTQLGLRAAGIADFLPYYQDLNARVSRQIVKDDQLVTFGIPTLGNQLQSLKAINVTTIVCLRFPNHPSDSEKADRVPLLDSTDLAQSLALVDSLLLQLDGALDFIQLQNEPLAGPGKYIDNGVHYGYYALEWLDTLGKHARNTIAQHGLDIGIISPGFHDVEQALTNASEVNTFPFIASPTDTVPAGALTVQTIERYWYRELMKISLASCDIIDLHLNVDGMASLKASIDNLDSLQRLVSTTSTQLPYSSLEWSPAKAKSDRIKTSSWMPAFLNAAYQDKVSLSDWNDFMDSLNYDPTFLQEAYCEMDRANFIHACYAGLIQFGAVGELDNQIFSTCALLTNSTVDPISAGEYHPNEPFYTLFQSIAPCPPASSGPEPTAEPIGFALFPNPAGHVVNISGDGIISNVRLFSVDGKLMFSDATAVNQYQLDLSDFKPGVYVVHINQTHSLKLIKT